MGKQNNSLWHVAIKKFTQQRLGMLSLSYIVFCGLVAVFAYVIAPDNTTDANQMHLEIHSKSPGFSVALLSLPTGAQNTQSWLTNILQGRPALVKEIPIASYRTQTDSLYITPYGGVLEKGYALSQVNNTPSQYIAHRTFYLGTDKYGRDVLSRLIIGSRISFFIGFIAVFISLCIGLFMGAIAGYFGGKIDALIMWVINIAWSIPTLLLVIAITLALGKGYWQVFIAVGLTMWVEVARVVRGQVLTTKQQQYVEAAKALGYSHFRIISKHILPNILAPVIVISAANFAAAILIESGLSFLGIGAQPPTPSWGAMIKNHYNYIILGKPYLALIPGVAIMSLVMAFMLVGNALRDALDVKN